MNDKQRIDDLEAVLAQFLKPVKALPFSLIVKSMSGHDVLPVEHDQAADQALVQMLVDVAKLTGKLVSEKPIRRSRPNEVGNDIEAYVIEAATKLGLSAERPKTSSGKGKTTGYPDIILREQDGRWTYLECKIFGEGKQFTTMRSFYLSPSENFKVTVDARHLLIAFGVNREPVSSSQDSYYRATSFKIVDLFGLKCDVKYEFNSDNRRLYQGQHVLAQGKI